MKTLKLIFASALLLSTVSACQQQPVALSRAPQLLQAQSARMVFHVVPSAQGWQVKEQRNPEALTTLPTKAEAIEAGRAIAKSHRLSQLIIHRANGTIETEYTYGNDPKDSEG